MRVVGIDPGTRSVGYGVIEEDASGRARLCDAGTIRCEKEKNLANRLVAIHRALQVVMREWRPEAAAVETAFFGKNAQTAIKIGEGRGVALLSAAEAEVEVFGYEPTLVKRALAGSGRAGKEQIRQMVRVRLGLEELPESDHASDALALALCHLNRRARGETGGSERELPPAVLKALGGKAPRRRGRRRR